MEHSTIECSTRNGTRKVNRRRNYGLLKYKLLFIIGVPAIYSLLVTLTSAPAPNTLSHTKSGRNLLWEDGGDIVNCTPPAIDEFPPDFFTDDQRRSGAVAFHVLLACYLFILLAVICDEYFVPAITLICTRLNIPDDIAGATFMAAATSSPELFINGIGTFITEGDIGVGTIVGSAVFNILAVPACCGLFASQTIYLQCWPVTRDCVMYAVAVVLLIFTLQDSRVDWYEALTLVGVYFIYLAAMHFNQAVTSCMKSCCGKKTTYKNMSTVLGETAPLLDGNNKGKQDNGACRQNGKTENGFEIDVMFADNEDKLETSKWKKFWTILTCPITCLLAITIPDCKQERWENWYPLTFAMCIIWIAATSYIVAWMITIVGNVAQIPDSIMGLTLLAAGMSVPEAVSSVIVTNQGHGSMGISNSIGSNTFDILLCLGLPWLIKSTFLSSNSGHFVQINSDGMWFSSISLLSTLALLYLTLAINKYQLDWKVGVICSIIYVCFLGFATVIELNIFFQVNLPPCEN